MNTAAIPAHPNPSFFETTVVPSIEFECGVVTHRQVEQIMAQRPETFAEREERVFADLLANRRVGKRELGRPLRRSAAKKKRSA